jgi:N-dimethylarginine dimethylaminohydrolase
MMAGLTSLYFMSPPSPDWALKGKSNFRSQSASPVNARAARAEWLALAERIEALGGTVVALPPSLELTGMPYAAEAGHVMAKSDGRVDFLLPRMKSPHRRDEATHWGALLGRMGARCVDLPNDVIWEGQGDVAHFEGVTLLFHGGRTTTGGMEAARSHFLGEVLPVEVSEPAFHGNMALLPLEPFGRLLVCPDVVAQSSLRRLKDRFGNAQLLEVSVDELRCYATNGLLLGRTLLAPSLVPGRVLEVFRSLGVSVELLSIPELCDKGGGGPRCLVCVAELPRGALEIPRENRLEEVLRTWEA